MKTRTPQDATLRNIRALEKKLDALKGLKMRVRNLERNLVMLWNIVEGFKRTR